MDVTFDTSALNAVVADLGKAPARIVPLARRVVVKAAADMERDAKAFAPVDTGALRNSIGTSLSGLSAEIGPTVNYGAFVELGTSRMGPRAYLGPAFDRHAGEYVDALTQAAARALGGA